MPCIRSSVTVQPTNASTSRAAISSARERSTVLRGIPASSTMRSSHVVQPLHQRFIRLCEVPSPTGEERAVADAVAEELRSIGAEVSEDGAAVPARAGAGNLLARVAGRGEEWLMFSAHLDTVPHEG